MPDFEIKEDNLPEGLGPAVKMGEQDLTQSDPNAGAGADPNAGAGADPNAGAEGDPNAGAGADPDPNADANVTWFNELTGGEYKTVEEIKAAKIADRLKWDKDLPTNYTTKIKELENLQKSNDELKTQINPRSHFVSDQEYLRQEMLRKHPKLDPTTLTSIVHSDLSTMSPIDILKMDMKIQYPTLKAKDSALIELIEKKYSISVDGFDINDGSTESLEVQMAVADTINKFEGLKADIKLPDMAAIESEKTEKLNALSDQWKPFVESMPAKLDKVTLDTVKDGKPVPLLEYAIDDKFREAVKSKMDEIVKSQAASGTEFSQEKQDALISSWKQFYLLSNLPAIIENHVGNKISEMTLEQFQTYHNPSTKPISEAPEDGTVLDDGMAAINADIMQGK